MGGGSYTKAAFDDYVCSTRGVSTETFKATSFTAQQMYKSRSLDEALNPYNVMRECCDNEEHPVTKPVILALDVTGSMGKTAVNIAKELSDIIEDGFNKYADIEFLTMGIGDLSYDTSPIQASQFESDTRIAEQLDKMYFEGGGGGNNFESYTAAWYFGIHNCKLDCWERGEKGLIITMGDEPCNPYLPSHRLNSVLGSSEQTDIETNTLVQEVTKKYDVYHICVTSTGSGSWYKSRHMLTESYEKYLPKDHVTESSEKGIKNAITSIIDKKYGGSSSAPKSETQVNANGELVW